MSHRNSFAAWLPLVVCVLAPMTVMTTCRSAWAVQPERVDAEGGENDDGTATPNMSRWIEMLDSDKFADRNEATRMLAASGPAAFAALERAVRGGSREVIARALDILQDSLSAPGDDETRVKARESLTRIAQGDHPASARLAREILDPTPETNPGLPALPVGRIRVQGARLQAIAQQIQVQAGNGARRIRVNQNGTRISIDEDGNGKIKMEVTEKGADGKTTTKKYEADSAADLKKNAPEAYRRYQQHAQNRARVILQIQRPPAAPAR